MTIVRVVSALIMNSDGRMLMTLRKPSVKRPCCWENPGGKVEAGESDVEALTREMREELGVTVTVGQLVSVARLDLEVTLLLSLYRCDIVDGEEPMPLESDDIEWIAPQRAVVSIICAPATYQFYRDIVDYIERSRS